jgi:UrcA family protein
MALTVAMSHALAGPEPKAPPARPAMTVRFADLKTSTVEGSRILYARISEAAHAVCGAGESWYPTQFYQGEDCYRATVDQVVAKLNMPLLTAEHAAHTHRPPTTPMNALNR